MTVAINRYPWMTLAATEAFVPLMERTGTSAVARSHRGFYAAFKRAGGVAARMGRTHRDTPGRGDAYMWWERRNEFIARHMGQVAANNEKLWTPNGDPTKRHLGLIAWAYTPDPAGVRNWLARTRHVRLQDWIAPSLQDQRAQLPQLQFKLFDT